MKLVKPSLEIIEQEPGLNGMLRHIEKCGRTCYKSEDKITKESAPKFVDMIINRGHTAMIEHGTIYLKCRKGISANWANGIITRYKKNPYSYVTFDNLGGIFITTNYRVLLQNGWLDDLQYQCEPTEHHVKRVTVKFICDRGVSHEFVRHKTILCVA